jgi:hypothetical protein
MFATAKNLPPSVAAIVASVNSALAQWPAEIRIQGSKQEMIADFDALLQSRLRYWARHNKNEYPENIVVYRGPTTADSFFGNEQRCNTL